MYVNPKLVNSNLQVTITLPYRAGNYELCLRQGGTLVKHSHITANVYHSPPALPPGLD